MCGAILAWHCVVWHCVVWCFRYGVCVYGTVWQVEEFWRCVLVHLHIATTVHTHRLCMGLCCRLYNGIREPWELQVNGQYLFFAKGVAPDWKAPQLAGGGRWCLEFAVAKGRPQHVLCPRGAATTSGSSHQEEAPISDLWLDVVRRSHTRMPLLRWQGRYGRRLAGWCGAHSCCA